MSHRIPLIALTDGGSDSVSLSLDTWRTPNADRPVIAQIGVRLSPSGTTAAQVSVQVDESGGTSLDYDFGGSAAAGLGADRERLWTIYIPPGGSYQVSEIVAGDGNNAITVVREWVL